MKKWLKKSLIALGVLAGVLLLLNIGFNIWLQRGLPHLIKKKTQYQVHYQSLSVDIFTGNISAHAINIKTLPNNNPKIPKIEGTVEQIEIGRLGLYDAIFNNEISSSRLNIVRPHLTVVLPPKNNEKKKKNTTIALDELQITEGHLTIFRHDHQKLLSAQKLSVAVEDIAMNPTTENKKIPIVFSKYHLSGEEIYFRPDDVYAFNAQKIRTENQQMSIENFTLKPLVSFDEFQKKFPKKRNLFDVSVQAIAFTDIVLTEDKIQLSDVQLKHPRLKMFTTSAAPEKKEQSFSYKVELKNVNFTHSELEIVKPNGQRNFYTPKLDLAVSNFRMNEDTAQGDLPFNYETFDIRAENTEYITGNQDIRVKNLHITPHAFMLNGNTVSTLQGNKTGTQIQLNLQQLKGDVEDWKIKDNQLFATINAIHGKNFNGNLTAISETPKKVKAIKNAIGKLTIKETRLDNFHLTYSKNNQPLHVKNIHLKMNNFVMGGKINEKPKIELADYQLNTGTLTYQTQYYNIRYGQLSFNNKKLNINDLSVLPRYSRAQFTRMISKEADLYTIKVKSVSGNGSWNFLNTTPSLEVQHLLVNGADANIFRSTIPPDDNSTRLLYSQLLREMKFPLLIKNMDIKNAHLVYEEDTENSVGAGKIILAQLNGNIQNLHSGKAKTSSRLIPIRITAEFMNDSPLKAIWTMNTASLKDEFTIKGTLENLNAEKINHFITPYMKMKAEGQINRLSFDFKGDKTGIEGVQGIDFEDLKITVLNDAGEKRGFLTGVANLFLRDNSKKIPNQIEINRVEREPHRSFFNLFWQGILSGLKKQLI